ncbi:acetoacetate--CoA ligase [bacterium]|nr:acetoacetate--CoA ligase [bacterium]
MSETVWSPTQEAVESTLLHRFSARHGFDDYRSLYEWSITDRAGFWQAVWEDGEVIASAPADAPLGREAMPGTVWFPGSRLNYAENLLRRTGDEPAIVTADESGATAEISRDRLRHLVGDVQRGLLDLGVTAGDRVAALLPNGLEAVVGMLAASAIGAIWSSCSPDFGPTAVIDRFAQIEPKVLIATDGFRYNGKEFDVTGTVRSALDAMPTVEHLITVDRLGARFDVSTIPTTPWATLVSESGAEPEFAQLPFDHPLYIVFSSGTTGPPKSIVHGAGGVLIKHLCEHRLLSNVHPGDRLFWFTTTGWMMWNWMVGSLASGATIVLFDGSPSHPDLTTLWRLAGSQRVTHFGSSPKFLSATANAGIIPASVADLSSVRFVGSTGSPLAPEQFDWVYANVSPDVQLASITGGTDLVGLFAGGVPTLPVRRGEIQARALGMAVESWDASGSPVIGTQGELVCVAPFPTMPVAFWGDPDGSRYRAAYFEEHPGVWTHGDLIEVRPEGGVIVFGRSDTTLNPGGVRIGTAEIYRAIETMSEVDDSIVVDHPKGDDVVVVLFVKTANAVALDHELTTAIKARIRAETSPRHVPAHVIAVSEIPYTRSGKKVEKAVRMTLMGETITNRDALANPDCLDQYRVDLPG